jgi:hypothetical protein
MRMPGICGGQPGVIVLPASMSRGLRGLKSAPRPRVPGKGGDRGGTGGR